VCYTFIFMQSFRDFEAGPRSVFGPGPWQVKFKWLQNGHFSLRHQRLSGTVKFLSLRSGRYFEWRKDHFAAASGPAGAQRRGAGRPLTDSLVFSRLAGICICSISLRLGEDMEKRGLVTTFARAAGAGGIRKLFAAAARLKRWPVFRFSIRYAR